MNIPLNIDWQQILLHLFNFVILAGGLYLLLYKPIKDFMEKRAAYYQGMADEAKEKLEHAQSVETEYQTKLAEVETEISEKRIEAARKAEEVITEAEKQAEKQAEKIVADARRNAEEERRKILASAEKEIAELAVSAAEKLVQESMDNTYEQFFESAKRG